MFDDSFLVTDSLVLFYHGPFSQWYSTPIVGKSLYSNRTLNCCNAEQYMMAEKALLFKDFESYEKIMDSKNPRTIKALGRKVKNFNQAIWLENCQKIVTRGNFLKFTQNEGLKELLLLTDKKEIAEASPYDKIWGIGIGLNSNAKDKTKWTGQNLLGKCLMRVRNRIYKIDSGLL